MTYDPNANPWYRRTKLLSGIAWVAVGSITLAMGTTPLYADSRILGGVLVLLGLLLAVEAHTATSTPAYADAKGGDSA